MYPRQKIMPLLITPRILDQTTEHQRVWWAIEDAVQCSQGILTSSSSSSRIMLGELGNCSNEMEKTYFLCNPDTTPLSQKHKLKYRRLKGNPSRPYTDVLLSLLQLTSVSASLSNIIQRSWRREAATGRRRSSRRAWWWCWCLWTGWWRWWWCAGWSKRSERTCPGLCHQLDGHP